MVRLTIFPRPEDGVRHCENSTIANVGGKDIGSGSLYIAESKVSWFNNEGQGFSLVYPEINLHAVSRDTSTFPHECLYLMVDGVLNDEDKNEDESDSEEEESPVTEVRFIPEDRGKLDAMYTAMSQCQLLHPDPDDIDSEEEEDEEGGFFEGEEGLEHLTIEGQARLDQFENMLQPSGPGGDNEAHINGHFNGGQQEMDTGQFEDADMQ